MNPETKFPYRYFLITFLWSWIFWGSIILLNKEIDGLSPQLLEGLKMPMLITGAFGPLVGAIAALRASKKQISVKKYLLRFTDLRLGWKTYLFTILILGGCNFIAWISPVFSGNKPLPMLLPSIWVFFPYLIAMMFLGGGQEEFGWRGYALPILENKFGIWLANGVLGIIWGLWHLPLWFVEGASQTYMNFGAFVLFTIGLSYILSWILSLSRNRPFSALFAHGLSNAFIPLMPALRLEENAPQHEYWLWVIITFATGLLITLFRTNRHRPN